jgi:hypothetical protein
MLTESCVLGRVDGECEKFELPIATVGLASLFPSWNGEVVGLGKLRTAVVIVGRCWDTTRKRLRSRHARAKPAIEKNAVHS